MRRFYGLTIDILYIAVYRTKLQLVSRLRHYEKKEETSTSENNNDYALRSIGKNKIVPAEILDACLCTYKCNDLRDVKDFYNVISVTR